MTRSLRYCAVSALVILSTFAVTASAALPEFRGIVKAAIQHDHVHLVGLIDVFDDVGVEHDQIGEFAHFERPDVLGETEASGGDKGRASQRLER